MHNITKEMLDIEVIFRLYYIPLCLFATDQLDDIEYAKDVVMDCYIKLWYSQNNGNEIKDIKSYLYMTVRNSCYDFKKNKHEFTITTETNIDACSDTNYNSETSEREARLWVAINSLPKKCRDIFLKSKRDDMTYNEIAEELNISVKTVETQITKAYKILRGKAKDIYLYLLSFFS